MTICLISDSESVPIDGQRSRALFSVVWGDLACMYQYYLQYQMEEPSISQRLIEHRQHKSQKPFAAPITIEGELKLFLTLLITYQRNYESQLTKYDPEGTKKDVIFVSRVPGYRKYQLIFIFYLRRLGLAGAFLMALLFPLPLASAYLVVSEWMEWASGRMSEEWEVVLVGLRCSALAYLCRYCLHFPSSRLNWMIYLGSMAVGALSSSTSALLCVYALALCLSYFKSGDAASRDSLIQEQQQAKEETEELEKLGLPAVGSGRVYLVLLGVLFVGCWFFERMSQQAEGSYLVELFLMGLLGTSQELSSFFPPLCENAPLPTANIYALGYLLPGLHLKAFFLLLGKGEWSFLLLAYLALHLPSLLMLCLGMAHRGMWLSAAWGKMSAGVQAASNGLVMIGVGRMLGQEECHLHIAFFTTLVLLTVTKLYKLNEIVAALLGVFLVASRAAVLHFNNKKSLAHFLCRKAQ